jgi:hypothetical protein
MERLAQALEGRPDMDKAAVIAAAATASKGKNHYSLPFQMSPHKTR